MADTYYWVCMCLKNTWLGLCPLGCHVFYSDYRLTGVCPLVPQMPG